MASNNQHISYTASDLLAYARGQMDAKQMHALEKAALEDDFLAEALEGYMMENTKSNIIDPQFLIIPNSEANQDLIAQKLAAFKEKIGVAKKDENNRPKIVGLWRQKWLPYAVAAAVIGGGLWFGMTYKQEETSNTSVTIAQNEPATIKNAPESVLTDSSSTFREENAQINATSKQTMDEDKKETIIARPGKIEENNLKPNNYSYKTDVATPAAATSTNKEVVLEDMKFANAEKKDNLTASQSKELAPIQNAPEKRADNLTAMSPVETMQNNRSQNSVDKYANARRFSFQGRVVDANNNPLPYSNIMIPGEEIGTYSDAKGNFNFIYVDSVLPVRARSLGYAAQNFTMQPDVKENRIVLREDEDLKNEMVFKKMESQGKAKASKPMIVETDTLYAAEPAVGWYDYNLYALNNNRKIDLPTNTGNRSVELSFDVDKYGEIQNITVEKSLGKDEDAEAIRLLKEGPKWKAKKGAKGKAKVSVKF